MLDITNYNVKRPITKAEYDDRVKKGLIKYGESVAVLNESGIPTITEYILLPYDHWWKEDVKMLQKDNWQNKRLLVYIYKHREDLWAYMVEKNVIPKDVMEDVINTVKNETEYIEFWKE